jgi:hypothetical protein
MSAKTLEIEDKSIDDAIEKACRDFGVPREKLNIEIISESTGGFLGVLSKKAKIKASLLSLDMDFTLTDDPEPKSETRIKIDRGLSRRLSLPRYPMQPLQLRQFPFPVSFLKPHPSSRLQPKNYWPAF